MAHPKKSLYEVLGIQRDANPIDIGLAYDKKSEALKKAGALDSNTESLLHEAYEVLADPKRRAAYDASMLSAEEKAAALQQAASPDLVLEDDDIGKRFPWAALVIAGVVIIIVLYFALRPERVTDVAAKKAEPAEVKPPPPLPPRPKELTSVEILKMASTASGQLVSVEMSGSAAPIGLAVAIEPNTVVSTCHGIQGGRKLVMKLGKESFGADLSLTDEQLDLCKLSVAGLSARPLALAAEEPLVGDKIYILGANASGEIALTEGTVKELVNSASGRVIAVSVPIAATGSGGGAFDRYGKLVGIATTPHNYGANLHVVLPSTWLSRVRSRGPAQPK